MDSSNSTARKFLLLFIFSIAMAFMESAIVIYLRRIYYPAGFGFPLAAIDKDTFLIEIVREAGTLVMLLTAGILSGKTTVQRFSYFIFCFGTWDIFYYVFLKLCIDWPVSLLEWDVLFLIPVPWNGPVLAPCILSLTMILFSVLFIITEVKFPKFRISKTGWWLMSLGSLIIIYSFLSDYLKIIFADGNLKDEKKLSAAISEFIPVTYNWWLFAFGESILLLVLLLILKDKHRSPDLKN